MPILSSESFGVQRQLSNSLSLKVDYVGSGSHRTNIGGYYNTSLTPGPGDPQTRAPYPYASPTLYDHGVGASTYNALQVSLDQRLSAGFSYQVAYTWSESYTADDGWFNSEGLTVQDAYHPSASRGYAGTNVPQALAINSIYEIPSGPGQADFLPATNLPTTSWATGRLTISSLHAVDRTRPWSTAQTLRTLATQTPMNARIWWVSLSPGLPKSKE